MDNENENGNENNNMNPYIVEMFDTIMAEEKEKDKEKDNSINSNYITNNNSTRDISKINELLMSKNALIGAILYIIISMPFTIKILYKISPSLTENNYKNVILRAMVFAILYIIITNLKNNNFVNKYLHL